MPHGADAGEDNNSPIFILDPDFVAWPAENLRKPCDLGPGMADVRQVSDAERLHEKTRHGSGSQAVSRAISYIYLIVALLCSSNG